MYLLGLALIIALIPSVLGLMIFNNFLEEIREGGEKNISTGHYLIFLAINFTGIVYTLNLGIMLLSSDAPQIFFYIPLYMGVVSGTANLGRVLSLRDICRALYENRKRYSRLIMIYATYENYLILMLMLGVILLNIYGVVGESQTSPLNIPAQHYIFSVFPVGVFLFCLSAVLHGIVVKKTMAKPENIDKEFQKIVIRISLTLISSLIGFLYIILNLLPAFGG